MLGFLVRKAIDLETEDLHSRPALDTLDDDHIGVSHELRIGRLRFELCALPVRAELLCLKARWKSLVEVLRESCLLLI